MNLTIKLPLNDNQEKVNHYVASYSGGRTSSTMIEMLLEAFRSGVYKGTLEFIYMDTGAEHPETYEYIKRVVEHYGIKLTCLQADFEQPVGVGHTYKIVDYRDLKHDMVNGPFARMMVKYGVPTVRSAWCTSRMKEETQMKYCNDVYGKGNYYTFIGLRADEPKRLVGDSANKSLSTYLHLMKDGYSPEEMTDMFKSIRSGEMSIDDFPMSETSKKTLNRRLEIVNEKKLIYFAEFCDFDKSDVIEHWSKKPFDLGIEEHLGNCVFCIKKSVNKVALATRDEPELAKQFMEAVESGNDRLNEGSAIAKGVMYRGSNSLESIIAKFSLSSREEIRSSIRSMKASEAGGCTESCEAFACEINTEQLELFEEKAVNM